DTTVAPTQCDHCKRTSSPDIKIRACTRCFTVGYCSKSCQRAEWRKHKLTCKPKIAKIEQAADQGVIDMNSEAVRLQTQCENGTWRDVGPINLLNNMNSKNVHTNSSSRRKELSLATKQTLGQTANSFMFRHSHDGIDENLVVFLHGAGDNHVPFDKLGQAMKLPQTATLSLSASMKMALPDSSSLLPKSKSNSTFVQLPFGLGYTWFEEMDYQVTGDVLPNDHPRRMQSLGHAVSAMNMLLSSLTDHSKNETFYWLPERIFLFGFSAGACLAMETCRLWKLRRQVPLGGAICIGGGIKTVSLPGCVPVNSDDDDDHHHGFTDVLIVTGSKDSMYSQEDALKTKSCYGNGSKVHIRVQQGKGHGMIGSREEMQTVMEFLSKRLVRRMPSMEDMSEK
ncbi:hypothetical protein ACHAWT_006175, partial [Skeletonema menzelii]